MDGGVEHPAKSFAQEEALQQVLTSAPEPKPRYTGGHFEENDVVAHIRFNERVDPDGNKVLFIEEIQSDWAHKGQSEGFETAEIITFREKVATIENRRVAINKELGDLPYDIGEKGQKELDEVTAQMNEWSAEWANLGPIPDWAQEKGKRLTKKAEEIRNTYDPKRQELIDELNLLATQQKDLKTKVQGLADNDKLGTVTPGPFVQDIHQWTNLALKRMVRWGTDNGFDSIGWVTGKQSADRYKVSTQISEVHWQGTDFTAFDHDGNKVIQQTGVTEKGLEELIGKEPAKKLMAQPNLAPPTSNIQQRLLSGLDLDIGGDYHKLIYDDVLLAQGKKIGKKYGAKVEKTAPFEPNMPALEKEWNELSAKRNEHLRFDTGFTPEDDKRLEEIINQMDFTDDADKIGEVWTMRLTDKLKQASKDGMPYYVALPPLAIGAAAAEQRTDAQRLQSKSDAQAIMAN